MKLLDLLGGALGSGVKLPLPWLPSQSTPERLPPVQLPRDERPHDRSLEWWHFMGHLRLLHPDVPDTGAAPPQGSYSAEHPARPASADGGDPAPDTSEQDTPPHMSFVLSILKARVQGVTKLASLVIIIDHERKTHTVSVKLGALGGVYFEPTDGSAFKFHFGPPGPSRPGPPEAWAAEGGMGIYRLTIDASRQLSLDLRQLSPAVLVGVRPDPSNDESHARGHRHQKKKGKGGSGGDPKYPADGVMRYAHRDEMAYYAFPALVLDGILGVGGQEQAVIGRAWMEHQWGDFPLGDYRWKYLAIDLLKKGSDKHFQLLAFRAQRRNEKHPYTHAVWVTPEGDYVVLDKNGPFINDKPGEDFNGYPIATTIDCPAQPQKGPKGTVEVPELHLSITPIFNDQECRTNLPPAIFPRFWEGACQVSGTIGGEDVANGSWAITELAGYD